ncbi:ABC transporter ATP-binding protein [Acidiferrimicrobium sp. IK]|uniref:ABC transporter ATP-binding protein n=1 Tax=Acidiferrimicrobium sp. IK TaxID=2871700 RepID=UPI0021CB58D1|nr:ABC transporter ATP-binding protein [Acidiferrimicrobium sp. IK]MCU4183478.1 ABC transporter ATP-binding protein [Acidiferrimicrobium sp. IK]
MTTTEPSGASDAGTPTPLLSVRDLDVRYGAARALSGISFDVRAGEVITVLGANGAGKSSLARALSGLIPSVGGTFAIDGHDLTGRAPHVIRKAGIIHLPEGRGVFPALSVIDNLRMAVSEIEGRPQRRDAIERACELFPVLGQRRRQRAGLLSGGEQQMLSLARALATSPKLIIADEMSLGLAPRMVDVVFDSLAKAQQAGVSVLMIEQFVHRALGFADSCLILERGTQAWSGPANAAAGEVAARYLGSDSSEVA